MKTTQPLFNPATHYRIEVRGRIDGEWLQCLDGSVEIMADETRQAEEDITILKVNTDQSGLVGLVRRLHGLGIIIQQLQIIQP